MGIFTGNISKSPILATIAAKNFTITVQTKESTADNGELVRVGRLHLIDLAGSENVVKAGTINSHETKRETGVINQSLLSSSSSEHMQ